MASGCKWPKHLAPSDISDEPQSERRDALHEHLADLTFLPNDPGLQQIVPAHIFGYAIDAIALSAPADCDTCPRAITLYRWNDENRSYSAASRLTGSDYRSVAASDLTHDGRDEIIVWTESRSHKGGMFIIGAPQDGGSLAVRFKLDTIRPTFVALPDKTFGIIEYDTAYARLLTGIAIRFPKRFWRFTGDTYLESSNDPTWIQIAQHFRDSVHQTFLLRKEEMQKGNGVAVAILVSSAVADFICDSSVANARMTIGTLLNQVGSKLSSEQYSLLLRLSQQEYAAPAIRCSTRIPQQTLGLLCDLDDALVNPDSSALQPILNLLLGVRSADVLLRAGSVLLSRDRAVTIASDLLLRSYALEPRNAVTLRARGRAFSRLGMMDSATEMYARSLQLDSTSTDARRVRQSLGY